MPTLADLAADPTRQHDRVDGLGSRADVPAGVQMPRPASDLLKTGAQRTRFCGYLRAGVRSWSDAEEVAAGFALTFANPTLQSTWANRLASDGIPDALIDGVIGFRGKASASTDPVARKFIFTTALRMLGFLTSQPAPNRDVVATLVRRANEICGALVEGRDVFAGAVAVHDAVTALIRDLVDLLPQSDVGLAERYPHLAELLLHLYAMPCDNYDAATLSRAQYFEMLLSHSFAIAGMFTIDGREAGRRIRLQQIVLGKGLVDAIAANLAHRLGASSQLGDQTALTALAVFATLVIKTPTEPEPTLAVRLRSVAMAAFGRIVSLGAEQLNNAEVRPAVFFGLVGVSTCCRVDLRDPIVRRLVEAGFVELLVRLTMEMLDKNEGGMVLAGIGGGLSTLAMALQADPGLRELLRARVGPATSPLFSTALGRLEAGTPLPTRGTVSTPASARLTVAMGWTRLTRLLDLRPQGDPERRCDWAGCTTAQDKGAVVKLSTCGRCHLVRYCSARCQQRDWVEGIHKTQCKLLAPMKR